MKLTKYLFPAVSLISGCASAIACGPYVPSIPTPAFFNIDRPTPMADYDRAENLRLWQQLTSERIPAADIEQVVYRDSRDEFTERTGYDHKNVGNTFYTYINNTSNAEIISLLMTAKEMEERRRDATSPWYYPSSRRSTPEMGDFSDIIETCRNYRGSRLRDRYGLQAVRALFASRCYGECVEYFDSVFAAVPDDNLMKRMAARYVAGCWSRMGHVARADTAFALAGDILSLSADDPVAFMSTVNPDAPQLMDYVRYWADDSAKMAAVVPVALRLASDPNVKNRGDWEYLLAYFSNRYASDPSSALRYIRSALTHDFSNQGLKDLARAYRMKIDAQRGDRSGLLSDLKWLEKKCDDLNEDADEWLRILQNIVYADLVPQLWKKHDRTTAIMLCAYADNLGDYGRRMVDWEYEDVSGWHMVEMSLDEMRASEKHSNLLDYRTLSFQMMGSLSSDELINVYSRMKSSSPLYNFLRRKMRTDGDFYNELIGTLALREENYSRAVAYFSRVSPAYYRTMNIYKGGYLSRDPFAAYPTRWRSMGSGDWVWDYDARSERHDLPSGEDAKLNFARRMLAYSREMKSAPGADRRAMARLMYAIGRRNAQEECWALTQYWRGSYVGLFAPYLDYWNDGGNFHDRNYGFLYEYDETVGHKYTEALYEKDVKAALRMFVTDEARAEAEYIMGNVRTVIAHYGSTSVADRVRTSCDNWKEWL
ncbi:MAG: hypothetical protein K2H98_00050 [Duncaniella sp.]|nr:hypothetical protein [Duncaniella sp.]